MPGAEARFRDVYQMTWDRERGSVQPQGHVPRCRPARFGTAVVVYGIFSSHGWNPPPRRRGIVSICESGCAGKYQADPRLFGDGPTSDVERRELRAVLFRGGLNRPDCELARPPSPSGAIRPE